ncbi:hypothetical protein [Paraconexibacter algicola]|uniref:Glycosyltransferase RgtA/B/C/D-like domain-containing protein n=1 Tax=Paraconexibacter algicola TaxID=2133960 RepID=A0A2T4UM45_9ACTN|nr:hypothetical protein [Paraconexibacter algicola]PTL60312.1 hypothetical protein C7Y72_12010 [Paraconexibacter algicola]
MDARPIARATAAVALVAGALWSLFDGGFVNYDAAYGLLWGEQVARGMNPEFVVPLAPTPKPLAMLLGLVLSPLGDEATTGLRVLSFLTLGALAVVAFSCARAIGGRMAGAVAVALVLSSVPLLSFGTRGYLDVLFVALALGAARALARDAPAHHVAGLLAAGGLVRPEAWLLSAVHVAWVWRLDRRLPRALVAIAAAPVVIWTLCDLLVTGDPLWSLTGTRANVEALGRDTGLGALLTTAPRRIGEIVREPVLAGSVLAILVLARRPDRQTAVLAALGLLSLLSFAGLVLAGSPVIGRYLLLPSVVLIVLVGGAAGRVRLKDRPAVLVATVALAAITIAVAPAQLDRLSGLRSSLRAQTTIERDLEATAHAARRSGRCRPITVEGHRQVPVIARELDVRAASVRLYRGQVAGLSVVAATDRIRRLAALDRSVRPTSRTGAPTDTIVGRTGSWLLLSRC